MMTFWTEPRIKTLRALWPTMLSAEIAAQIGCTRKAVIGKAHRLALPPITRAERYHRQSKAQTRAVCEKLSRAARICAMCSGPLPGTHARRRYCSDDCLARGKAATNAARWRKVRQQLAEIRRQCNNVGAA